MSINLTLLGQMITFAIFVWFTMRFIWPPLMQAMNNREHKITEGLQAAEKGQQRLVMAEEFAKRQEVEAKQVCITMIAEAKQQAEQIIINATLEAKQQKEEIIKSGAIELENNKLKLLQELKAQLAKLIITGAEKIIKERLNQTEHQRILVEITNKLYDSK